jgi:hypothetical protein
VSVGSVLLDALVAFVFFGGAAFLIGVVVEAAVRARRLSAGRRKLVGLGSLVLFLILVIPVNVWIGCGEGCVIDPTPLVTLSGPLQVVGWFAGRFVASRYAESSAGSDVGNR